MYSINIKILYLVMVALLLSGCYHAKITTGEPASSEVYENKWAVSWIGGLIPPDVVDVENQCTNGVAMVETRHSFLNMLVAGLTSGIFTPMEITVTCADAQTASDPANADIGTVTILENAAERDFIQGFQQAADQAATTGRPVRVSF